MNNENLMKVWERKQELSAEGNKLNAEGKKLFDEGRKLSDKWGDLSAEAEKLFAEGDKLHAEGDKLHAKADLLWVNAVKEKYENIEMGWEWNDKTKSFDCHLHLSDGKVEIYK